MPLPDAKERFLKRAGGQYRESRVSRFLKRVRGLFNWSQLLLAGSVVLNIYLLYYIYENPRSTAPASEQVSPEGKDAGKEGGNVVPDTLERIHRDTVKRNAPGNSDAVPEESSGKSHDPGVQQEKDQPKPNTTEQSPEGAGAATNTPGESPTDTAKNQPALTQQTQPEEASPGKEKPQKSVSPEKHDKAADPEEQNQSEKTSMKDPLPQETSEEGKKQKDTLQGSSPAVPGKGAEPSSEEKEKQFSDDLKGFKKREQEEVENDTSNKIFIEEE